MINIKSISKGGKAFYLAYDQGFEHGPEEFDYSNVDPLEVIRIAKLGGYNGLIVHKGIADKYRKEIKASKVPLILKLNGKTNLFDGEPVSTAICTVDEALNLGAKAVGYTIYVGSEKESVMLKEFEDILRKAHKRKIPVVAWVYPRGKVVNGKSPRDVMAYAARIGLEIDSDLIKIKSDGVLDDLKWAVKSAGRAKVVFAGGEKTNELEFIDNIKRDISSGAFGVAVGRNIWKSKDPIALSKKIKNIIFCKSKRKLLERNREVSYK